MIYVEGEMHQEAEEPEKEAQGPNVSGDGRLGGAGTADKTQEVLICFQFSTQHFSNRFFSSFLLITRSFYQQLYSFLG